MARQNVYPRVQSWENNPGTSAWQRFASGCHPNKANRPKYGCRTTLSHWRSTVVKTPFRRRWLRGYVRGDDITATCFITRWRLFDLLEAFFFVLVYFLLDVSGMLYRRFIFHVLETVVNVLQIQRRQYFTGWRGWGVGGRGGASFSTLKPHYSCASTLVLFFEASWQVDPVCIHLPLWSQYLVTYPANWDK